MRQFVHLGNLHSHSGAGDGGTVPAQGLTGSIQYNNSGVPGGFGNWNGSILSVGKAGIAYFSATNERGFLVKIINRTGHTSVKGELVSCSPSADGEAILQSSEYDTIGVVQEAGVAEGSEMWVWGSPSICQVLYEDGNAATRGNLLLAAATDGRAYDVAAPGVGLPAVDTHFKECGHVTESKGAGTNVLVLASLHFN